MSRLEEELKLALRAKEPPAGLTDRVLARIRKTARTKVSDWQAVTALLRLPRVRLIAVGAVVTVLLALSAAHYFDQEEAKPLPGVAVQPQKDTAQEPPSLSEPGGQRDETRVISRTPNRRTKTSLSQGEIARDRLLLALYITTTKLAEARQTVRARLGRDRTAAGGHL